MASKRPCPFCGRVPDTEETYQGYVDRTPRERLEEIELYRTGVHERSAARAINQRNHEQRKRIVELWLDGLSMKSISAHFGGSPCPARIGEILRQHCVIEEAVTARGTTYLRTMREIAAGLAP